MPTADKVVVEFDANIKTFVTKTIQATKVYESHSQSIQKNSIAAKNFLNKSQKGQTAILERSAKSFEQAQKTITAGMRRSVTCLLYTSPSPRDRQKSRMPSSA